MAKVERKKKGPYNISDPNICMGPFTLGYLLLMADAPRGVLTQAVKLSSHSPEESGLLSQPHVTKRGKETSSLAGRRNSQREPVTPISSPGH